LIHDDIEDQSDTRHGRETLWHLHGEALAINAGDAMFTLARMAIFRLAEIGKTPLLVNQCAEIFDKTSLDLCLGQHADISFEKLAEVSEPEYMQMIAGKTSALLGASAAMGALIGSESAALAQQYFKLGEAIGLSFQIIDDILGIWGNPARTGKPVADDLRSRKKSLPLILALSSPEASSGEFRKLFRQPELSEEEIQRAIQILDDLKIKEQCEVRAAMETARTRKILAELKPVIEWQNPLVELIDVLLERSY
jgi:geranylgeranyl diphosphate synthase, type I